MNAGRDYHKARKQAQANATLTAEPWCIVGYSGSWWVHRVSTFTIVPDDLDIVHPEPVSQNETVNKTDA